MTPLGISIVFAFTGFIIGAGLSLIFANLTTFIRAQRRSPVTLGSVIGLGGATLLGLLGVALVFQGGLWTYIIIFR